MEAEIATVQEAAELRKSDSFFPSDPDLIGPEYRRCVATRFPLKVVSDQDTGREADLSQVSLKTHQSARMAARGLPNRALTGVCFKVSFQSLSCWFHENDSRACS